MFFKFKIKYAYLIFSNTVPSANRDIYAQVYVILIYLTHSNYRELQKKEKKNRSVDIEVDELFTALNGNWNLIKALDR